ncbi:MAG TPA: site-2 protease family protein, partial [Acidimicrobiales bacterium]
LTSRIRRADVGDEVTLTVVRDGESFDVSTEIGARPDGVSGGTAGAPFLGVGQSYPEETLGPVETLGHATTETAHMMREATGALVGFFSPNGLSDFADNVGRGGDEPAAQPSSGGASDDEGNRMLSILGVVRLGASAAEEDGLIQLLFIFFQINIFIGILNMVPLPPLDGGHAAVAIYERIRSRRGRRYHADVAKLLPLTYAVVMGLVVLGVTSLYLDVVSPIDL